MLFTIFEAKTAKSTGKNLPISYLLIAVII